MTITIAQIWVYSLGLAVLVLSPGPVVGAVVARVLANGFRAAWPVAAAVMVGDFLWVTIALVGLSAIIQENETILNIIKFGGAAYLIYLGIKELRHAKDQVGEVELSRSQRFWPNFRDGLIIIMSNPKAAFFYLALVPNFFNLQSIGKIDVVTIGIVSALIPFLGNMVWALTADMAARKFRSAEGRATLRRISGISLIIVGIAVVFL